MKNGNGNQAVESRRELQHSFRYPTMSLLRLDNHPRMQMIVSDQCTTLSIISATSFPVSTFMHQPIHPLEHTTVCCIVLLIQHFVRPFCETPWYRPSLLKSQDLISRVVGTLALAGFKPKAGLSTLQSSVPHYRRVRKGRKKLTMEGKGKWQSDRWGETRG